MSSLKIGPEWPFTPVQLREMDRNYCRAVRAAHPGIVSLDAYSARHAIAPSPSPHEIRKLKKGGGVRSTCGRPSRKMRLIAEQVAAKWQVGLKDILGYGRSQPAIAARHEAWYLCRLELGASLTRIALNFGRDHTTILHGIRAHAKRNGLPMPDEADA